MKNLFILILLLQFGTLFAEEQLLDEVVAVVDEGIILRSELDASVNNFIGQIQAKGMQLPPKSVLEQQVLDRLIMQELQIQKADAAGVRISETEVDQALNKVASQNKITLQQMQMALENDGLNFADFRNNMLKELKTEKIRNGLANQNVKVSEHEIDLFLADNNLSQNEVHLGHILIPVATDADDAMVEKTQKKVNKLYKKLVDGKDFSQIAIKYSAGQKALDGGDLGWRASNELPTLFADQIKMMKAGEYTHPVRSASGFHIIKLIAIREPQNKMITQYHARHIMIQNTELITPAQGMEMINAINKKLQDGEDFAKIAEEKSDDVASAALGGDLGWFQLKEFGQRFADVIKRLDDNEVSSPFQSQAGWHIAQRLGVRENDVTDEFKRSQAKQAIHARKMNEEIDAWLREIRGEAFVDIRL